jgi:hypothetical protein
VPLKSNPSTALFVPDKQGGPVSQRSLERFGQSRPAPTAMALFASTPQTVSTSHPVNLAWQEILIDGLGLGGFGSQTAYHFGATLSLGAAIWFIYVNLAPFSTAANDQWTVTVQGITAFDQLALGSAVGIPVQMTATYPHPFGPVSILLPPVVVSGWYPAANGNPTSANCNLNLAYAGSQSSVEFTHTVVVSRGA